MSDCCRTKKVSLPNTPLAITQGDCGDEICIPSTLTTTFNVGNVIQREVCLQTGSGKVKAWAILLMTTNGSELLRYENSAGHTINGVPTTCPCESNCDVVLASCKRFWGFDYFTEADLTPGNFHYFDVIVDGNIEATVAIDYLASGDGTGKASWYDALLQAVNGVGDWLMTVHQDTGKDGNGFPVWQLGYAGQGTPTLEIHKWDDTVTHDNRDEYIFEVQNNGLINFTTRDMGLGGITFGTSHDEGDCNDGALVQGCIITEIFDTSLDPATLDANDARLMSITAGSWPDLTKDYNYLDTYDGTNRSSMYKKYFEDVNQITNLNITVASEAGGNNKIEVRVEYSGPGNETIYLTTKADTPNSGGDDWKFEIDGAGNITVTATDGGGTAIPSVDTRAC